MPTSLKERLFRDASVFPALVALLASGSPAVFRWRDQQLNPQGETFPAVVVQQISNPNTYGVAGRLPTSTVRVQFSVYGSGNNSQNADAVVTALTAFLDQWSGGSGISGLPQYSNLIVADRDFGIAKTEPLTYLRIVDAQLFFDDSI